MQRVTTDDELVAAFNEAFPKLKECRSKDLDIFIDYVQGALHVERLRLDLDFQDEFSPFRLHAKCELLRSLLTDLKDARNAKAE